MPHSFYSASSSLPEPFSLPCQFYWGFGGDCADSGSEEEQRRKDNDVFVFLNEYVLVFLFFFEFCFVIFVYLFVLKGDLTLLPLTLFISLPPSIYL